MSVSRGQKWEWRCRGPVRFSVGLPGSFVGKEEGASRFATGRFPVRLRYGGVRGGFWFKVD